ncbi:hypothetical protein U14_00127 [Candidatus Moduliflexus flocculans]|uniref:AAA-ATPase-like domain-containing protein n=1 Tax=Candidatus Moduliflexus flocculans TaxID=1499966 RepID=A0A0S6VSP3_9BACT|nr:hypothetical protein U14_00127 [Candidatus Moduliflexus flocculans]
MKKLPIGIQTFEKLIDEDYLYVDKTREVYHALQTGQCLFLSRPRRFGKSLLISTVKAIFEGRKDLFRGLWIEDKLDWQPSPVIHLDFSLVDYAGDTLQDGLLRALACVADDNGLDLRPQGFKEYFYALIRALAERKGKVAVLIDEYDKPIIDYMAVLPQAHKNRDILRDFYQVLKGSDPYLRFVLLTGVSKFSRVSVFSGLNNLQDLTLAPQFGTLAGYTQEELERDFADYLDDVCRTERLDRADLLTRIRRWYNGYSWNGTDRVYNPFSILNFFAQRRFRNYWFATGTPTMLIDMITSQRIQVEELERKVVSETLFESYDLDHLDMIALLFQTGYLTVADVRQTPQRLQYVLKYPNQEVKDAFLTHLLQAFTQRRSDETAVAAFDLYDALEAGNLDKFLAILTGLLAKIPYTLHLPYEAYYHSLIYMILALMGVDLDLEVLTSVGRIDGVLETRDRLYIIEFKYGKAGSDADALAARAIEQIERQRYAERYANDLRPIFLLGLAITEDRSFGYRMQNASLS